MHPSRYNFESAASMWRTGGTTMWIIVAVIIVIILSLLYWFFWREKDASFRYM